MNAFKRLFGIGQETQSSDVSPDQMQKLNLFSRKAEKEKSLVNKIDKYKKKYKEQRLLFKQEHQKGKDNILNFEKNQEKIGSLTEEIEKKIKENKVLGETIAEDKRKLIEMNMQLEKMGKTVDFDGSSLNLAPSLTSLQYDNLKEKLVAKNKRVVELEEDLAKENQKTENMMKEITFLKIEIGKV